MVKYFKSIFVGLLSILFMVAVLAPSVRALEGKAGETITTEQEVADLEARGLLPHSMALIYKIMVKDYKAAIPIKGYSDRTRKAIGSKSWWRITDQYKGKASIDNAGIITNYGGGGLPFPDLKESDPQAGAKAAYNYDLGHRGDDFAMHGWIYYLTDAQRNVKTLVGSSDRLKYNYRTDYGNIPTLNKDGKDADIWYKDLISFQQPFASKGLAQLVIKYCDQTKERDVYMYIPGLRRNIRASSSNRCDALGGFVFIADDGEYWSGDTSKFTYKYIKTQEVLVNAMAVWEEVKNQTCIIKGAPHHVPRLEKRNVWVIEQRPKDPTYCFSKRVYYQDPESWFYVLGEGYDKAGNLWKGNDLPWGIFPNKAETGGGTIGSNATGDNTDFKIMETAPYNHQDPKFNNNPNPEIYSLDYLRKAGR
jgi:hypothetical protein